MLDAGVVVLVLSGAVLLVSPGMPLRLKRREQKEYVLRRARELAESGRFEGWQGIEFELRFFEGVREGPHLADRAYQKGT